ncbi:gamma-glutamyltransferase [Cyanobium sp. HWJ4-Hawea]|uniref:gamma-glutamyltransferase n=1 Tax=Cyanobium sp. HWJ4-Hawea TaxID=2823713 RepID=UPI0020CBAD88|nr:gamma-glutamyltransferase [Cyanobium sp. HWJ4-Hawea]MCP9808855.1 gamma-glutamyltransferase [Cyanobium sp. HWJ4-Hawea]
MLPGLSTVAGQGRSWFRALALLAVGANCVGLPAQANVLQEQGQRFQPIWSAKGMVASQELIASGVGAQILRQGGNAVDAAVATSFALAVTLPQAGNLGGGGFLVAWLPGASPARQRGCLAAANPEVPAGKGTAVAVDFRETAPLAAQPQLFLKADGSVDRQRTSRSLLSTGVPGTPAGLLLSQRCYGRLPLAAVMAPAIRLADQGFPVGKALADSLVQAAPLLQADQLSRRIFFHPPARPGGSPIPYRPGEILRQPLLAASLRRIALAGERGFYQGPTGSALVQLMRSRGGLISQLDLDRYRAQLRRPLVGQFRGLPVVTMPPPSGGGVTLLLLLQILEPLDLAAPGLNSAATIHTMVEALNLAYRDRNQWLGDPDQIPIPLERLLSRSYADQLRQSINTRRHRQAIELAKAASGVTGGTNTTHLSVVDRQGGLVATTTTLNFAYGNGVSVPGAGFLLNNEMDDFSFKAGTANAYGLVQGMANLVAPGRRPLSSMTPTLVLRPDGSPWFATGSPGGSRIISTVLQVLLNRIVHGLNLASAVAAPRIHSQLWPDQINIEQGISPDTQHLLEAMGHLLEQGQAMGSANSVEALPRQQGRWTGSLGVADPRRLDAAAVAE